MRRETDQAFLSSAASNFFKMNSTIIWMKLNEHEQNENISKYLLNRLKFFLSFISHRTLCDVFSFCKLYSFVHENLESVFDLGFANLVEEFCKISSSTLVVCTNTSSTVVLLLPPCYVQFMSSSHSKTSSKFLPFLWSEGSEISYLFKISEFEIVTARYLSFNWDVRC